MLQSAKYLLNLVLIVICTQFAFATPDWEDCPSCYEFTATISGGVILNEGIQLGGGIFAAFDLC